MIKVSVIKSEDDNTKSKIEDIEIVKSLKDASGQYVYFKDIEDDLDFNFLIEAYTKATDNNLDYIVLNSHGLCEDVEIKDTYNFDEFNGNYFTVDLNIRSKLIRRSVIKDDFSDNLDLLNWDVILSAHKFSFMENDDFKPQKYCNMDYAIEMLNRMTQKIIDYRSTVKLNFNFFDYKMEELIRLYESCPENERENSYLQLKEDFTKMIFHKRFTSFSVNTTVKNKYFFDCVVYTRDFKEFENLLEEYYIMVDVEEIRQENKVIKMENAHIQRQIRTLKTMNRNILNSKSWSITKPLRDVKRLM